jgi:hypothetical protein
MAKEFADRLYPGMGIANQGSPQDSGVVAKSASPATVAVTVPANADATQPTIDHGTAEVSITAVNGAAVLGAIDIYASDGTNTEYLDTIAASSGAVAGQGATFYRAVFSALVNITTIKTLTARLVTTANNNVSMALRFNFGD